MRSELISLIVQGDKIPLRAAIKEWLEYYPDLLKTVLERNEKDVEQDIFLKASATAKFNLGESWPGHGKLSYRPSISAILHYAAHQVGATDFGNLAQYSAEMKLTYIENHLKDEDLTENDKTILKTMHIICKTDDNYLDVTINLIQSLKTKLEPPKIIKELALNEDANQRKLAKEEYDKDYHEYTTTKEINSAHLNSFLNLPQLCDDIRDQKKKFAKINVAVGVLGALVGGATVVAILLTAPISLPIIIGISLIGLAVAATFLATFSRAQNFLNEASYSQKVKATFNSLSDRIGLSILDKNSSLKTLEDKAEEVNNSINKKMAEIEQYQKVMNIKKESTNRDTVEQMIKNNTPMDELEKLNLRYKVLNKEQIRILISINDNLLEVGKNKDVDINLKQALLNFNNLPKDIQLHFQDYLYQKTDEEHSYLQIGIKQFAQKQSGLFQNTKTSPSDEPSSSNSKKRGWSKFSYEASPKQSPAGLLFTSQEAGSELNKKALEVKNQLRTFKDDSKISYDSPSYTR